MDASRLLRVFALVASTATLLVTIPAQAVTPDGAPLQIATGSATLCIRGPDVTFEGDSYYVTFVRGPCSGAGAHDVMIGRWNPSSPASFAPISVWTQSLADARLAPTARVSSAGGLITVAAVDRSLSLHQLRADFFAPNLSRPMMPAMPLVTSGTVLQLSLDCGTGAMPPCVLSTIEIPSGQSAQRAFAYFNLGAATPISLGVRSDLPIAIASVAGAPGQSAAAFVTNSLTPSAPHAMVATAPMAATVQLGASAEPAIGGVAAMLVSGSGAAFWTVPNFLEFAVRPTWSGAMRLVSGRATIVGAQAYFGIDDGVAVGNNAVLVGRNSATAANTEGAPIAFVSFVPENGLMMVPSVVTTLTPKSPTRLAAGRNHCPLFGTAVAVYAAGATASTEVFVQRLACTANSECVDSSGAIGTCVSNRCVFPVGTICNPSADAGVDASTLADARADTGVVVVDVVNPSMDATSSGDSGVIVPVDVVSNDGSANIDANASDDASVAGDSAASPDGSSMLAVTGGACGCRVSDARSRDVRPLLLGSLVLLATLTRRRRHAR